MFDQFDMSCRICLDPTSYEDEIHTFSCKELVDGLTLHDNVEFEDIYRDLDHQLRAIKNFMKIIKKRDLLLELRGI